MKRNKKEVISANGKYTANRKTWKQEIRRNWPLYVLILPSFVLAVIFCYIPMGGLVMAFQDYKPWLGITGSEFVGLDNFRQIFEFSESYQAIINTVIIAVSKIVLGLIVPIIMALLRFVYGKNIFFARRYVTDWDIADDEPYLIIELDRDYLQKIKSMVLGQGAGGTFLLLPDGESLFSVNDREAELFRAIKGKEPEAAYEVTVSRKKYQIVESKAVGNGIRLVTYYPIREMLRPVRNITGLTNIVLVPLMLVGLFLLMMYYKNILLQLKIITEKLKEVEGGDFNTRIDEVPDNEFAYVFQQFNRMVERIRKLLSSTLKEQQLRNQAEQRQLQLQIHPHFLYNSLSYIVTVADRPKAVTEMAAHLADYYRYCTKKKSVTTIAEEVAYARAYLSIMAMRKNIDYTINVPDELGKVQIIPLLLEPVIENAIEHGIEERENAKHIFMKIYRLPGKCIRFEISDDGNGMTDAQISKLMERLARKERKEEESVGLWNVNQRLVNYYGKSAGLRFGKSMWGGLTVSFTIEPENPPGSRMDTQLISDDFLGKGGYE